MDSVYVGIWSIVPPLVSIVFALIFKEIISSLIIGLLTGTFIYSFFSSGAGYNPLDFVFSRTNSYRWR